MRKRIVTVLRPRLSARSTRIGIALVALWCVYLVVAQPWEQSPEFHMRYDGIVAKCLYWPLLAGINVADGLDWIRYRNDTVTLNPADVTAVPPPPGFVIVHIPYPSPSEFVQRLQGFSPLRIGIGILIVFGIAKLPIWVFRRKPHA